MVYTVPPNPERYYLLFARIVETKQDLIDRYGDGIIFGAWKLDRQLLPRSVKRFHFLAFVSVQPDLFGAPTDRDKLTIGTHDHIRIEIFLVLLHKMPAKLLF